MANRYPIRDSYHNVCRDSGLTNDYESLKQQCDLAVDELGALQAQHNETTRRYDRALRVSLFPISNRLQF